MFQSNAEKSKLQYAEFYKLNDEQFLLNMVDSQNQTEFTVMFAVIFESICLIESAMTRQQW